MGLITLQKPFDVGLPYINPICLLPKSRVGHSKDWDGILFSALGRQQVSYYFELIAHNLM